MACLCSTGCICPLHLEGFPEKSPVARLQGAAQAPAAAVKHPGHTAAPSQGATEALCAVSVPLVLCQRCTENVERVSGPTPPKSQHAQTCQSVVLLAQKTYMFFCIRLSYAHQAHRSTFLETSGTGSPRIAYTCRRALGTTSVIEEERSCMLPEPNR